MEDFASKPLQLFDSIFRHVEGYEGLPDLAVIALVVTPIAFGLGVYLVPLMIGAPTIAAPRVTLLGYWLYVVGALSLLLGAAVPGGDAAGWWGYTPLANGTYSPGAGMNLWVIGVSRPPAACCS